MDQNEHNDESPGDPAPWREEPTAQNPGPPSSPEVTVQGQPGFAGGAGQDLPGGGWAPAPPPPPSGVVPGTGAGAGQDLPGGRWAPVPPPPPSGAAPGAGWAYPPGPYFPAHIGDASDSTVSACSAEEPSSRTKDPGGRVVGRDRHGSGLRSRSPCLEGKLDPRIVDDQPQLALVWLGGFPVRPRLVGFPVRVGRLPIRLRWVGLGVVGLELLRRGWPV